MEIVLKHQVYVHHVKLVMDIQVELVSNVLLEHMQPQVEQVLVKNAMQDNIQQQGLEVVQHV